MRGDREAFTSLARGAADRSYALAYRILRDPHRAQDAAQQALIAAWRDLPALRDPTRFDAWLRRLVVNACYTEARAERRWAARVRLISPDTASAPDPARSVAVRDDLEHALPPADTGAAGGDRADTPPGPPLTEIATTLAVSPKGPRGPASTPVRQLRAALDDGRLETSQEHRHEPPHPDPRLRPPHRGLARGRPRTSRTRGHADRQSAIAARTRAGGWPAPAVKPAINRPMLVITTLSRCSPWSVSVPSPWARARRDNAVQPARRHPPRRPTRRPP